VILPARVRRAYGACWPTPLCADPSVRVDYVAGYGDAADDVPPALRRAITIGAAWLWDHRGEESAAYPKAFYSLLHDFRIRDLV